MKKKPQKSTQSTQTAAPKLTAHLAPANLLAKNQPVAHPAPKTVDLGDNVTALETFLCLADAGLKDKDKVLVQFYPDFLKELGKEIQGKLKLLESYQKEISKAVPEDCDDWWNNEEKNYPKTVRTLLQNLQKENARLYKQLAKKKP